MNEATTNEVPTSQKISAAVRRIPGKRQVLIGVGIASVIAGSVIGWPWIVAAGLVPVLLSVLPCVVMCALGMCAMRTGQKSCHGPGDAGSEPSLWQVAKSPSQEPRS